MRRLHGIGPLILRDSQLLNKLEFIRYGMTMLNPSFPGGGNAALPQDSSADLRDQRAAVTIRLHTLSQMRVRARKTVKASIEHGHKVVLVTKDMGGRGMLPRQQPAPTGDALITDQPGRMLAALSADCVLVYLVDPIHPAIGLVHAGWAGTLKNVIGNTVVAMERSFDTNPHALWAYLGPSICPAHYQRHWDEDYPAIFGVQNILDVEVALKREGEFVYPNISETIRRQLLALGLRPDRIEVSPICTFEDRRFGSARRDGKFAANHMGMIMMRPWFFLII